MNVKKIALVGLVLLTNGFLQASDSAEVRKAATFVTARIGGMDNGDLRKQIARVVGEVTVATGSEATNPETMACVGFVLGAGRQDFGLTDLQGDLFNRFYDNEGRRESVVAGWLSAGRKGLAVAAPSAPVAWGLGAATVAGVGVAALREMGKRKL